MSAIKQSQLMTGGLLIVGTCDILSISKPIISPVAGDLMPLSAGLQLAEELAGTPVHGNNPLGVEDLPDVGEFLVRGDGIAPLTLAGAGVSLILLEGKQCNAQCGVGLRKLQRTRSDSLGHLLHSPVFVSDIREIGANLVSKRSQECPEGVECTPS